MSYIFDLIANLTLCIVKQHQAFPDINSASNHAINRWRNLCTNDREKFQLHKNLCYFHFKDSFRNLNYFLFSSKIVSLECVLGWKLQYIFYGILSFFPFFYMTTENRFLVSVFFVFFSSSSNKHKYTLDHSRNFSVSR